jgi:hypothetical protein
MSKTLEEIWADDHLDRREEATYLSGFLVARYRARKMEEGFVLAVNGDWGMGKSFMLQRWCEQMQLAGHPVVRFDAWENDFTPEPLVAFIAEINSALGPLFDQMPLGARLHQEWYEKAKAVLIPGVKTIGFALAKHGLGVGAAQLDAMWHGDAGKDEADEFDTAALGTKLSKVVDEALKSHSNTKNAIKAFKIRLAALIEYLGQNGVQLPICVFIDELDRCRPNYAIQLLEGIEHLFGVSGLHFIVATNLDELSHSVRAVYGSGFSADKYLKRFFDMEYSLPTPGSERFAIELMTSIVTPEDLNIVTGLEPPDTDAGRKLQGLPFLFERYAAAFDLRLRDQQQAAKILKAAFLSLSHAPIHVHFLIFLVMLYQKNTTVYHRVVRALNFRLEPEFPQVFPSREDGRFSVPSIDGKSGWKNIPAIHVAEVYLNYIKDNAPEGPISSIDFPINLFALCSRQGLRPEDLRQYFEIVRHAGRFIR